jgi:hypothetical protein
MTVDILSLFQKTPPVKSTAAPTVSKSDIAAKIYNEMVVTSTARPPRKEIIKRFMDEAGLTLRGANTYLYNLDKKFKTVV